VALRTGARPEELARRLRAADPPVIARLHDGELVLDPRTIQDDEVDAVIAAARAAIDGAAG
jgi:L-seryl-tRNA(Ser) seleniumtransferase